MGRSHQIPPLGLQSHFEGNGATFGRDRVAFGPPVSFNPSRDSPIPRPWNAAGQTSLGGLTCPDSPQEFVVITTHSRSGKQNGSEICYSSRPSRSPLWIRASGKV